MSTNSVHRVIGGASHEKLIADEEDSKTTTQAILDVVSAIRNTTPLTKWQRRPVQTHLGEVRVGRGGDAGLRTHAAW